MSFDSTGIFIGLSSISTLLIAILTYVNYHLSKKIANNSENEKLKYQELLNNLVASQLATVHYQGNSIDTNFTRFNECLERIRTMKKSD